MRIGLPCPRARRIDHEHPRPIPPEELHVSEVWNSVEQLQAYGEILMPMLADAGVEFSAEPEIFEVHRID